jgi:hypothetical protein
MLSRQKHTNMKLKDRYDFVPAFVGTFGVLSISRSLGLRGAKRGLRCRAAFGSDLNRNLGLEL